jgi:hypothetical protein
MNLGLPVRLGLRPMAVSGRHAVKDFECSERSIVSTPYMSIRGHWLLLGTKSANMMAALFS